ncbi:hypothetical protein [Sulfuriroseicoccus oceanibius]|uniref:Uncharacterized protein n=1 Tax=Sulfuriroseicoccus oceanibius TaxID=2707525 RepID=A0A6B3LBN0_9BACT|nr:hypothetical protein [Sulfuriroseicoccus oceanibius]QQL44032.1 hypothetical protein G3M56_009005 [Sulfuriroseicoccus oceanibius]
MISQRNQSRLNAGITAFLPLVVGGMLGAGGLCATNAATEGQSPSAQPEATATEAEVLELPEFEARAKALAERQDELSMRLQDLSWKWADDEIVTFLEEIDFALLDARDLLEDGVVGGETIAAENDAIEKIYQAAKQQQQQQQQEGDPSSSLGAMMDQLDYMTGKKKGDKPGDGEGEGDGAGQSPGEGGGNGAETTGNLPNSEASGEVAATRTVPKGGGISPAMIPSEFREGMEALRDELDTPENQ